jgi:hypothetical protein
LAERRAFAFSTPCPAGTVEASFSPSNHALQTTAVRAPVCIFSLHIGGV